MIPVRLVGRVVRCAVAPGEQERERDHRNDHDQHQDRRDDDQLALAGREVIIVEDIVDTGHTLKHVLDAVNARKPASVAVCTLLLKPNALQHTFDNIAYVGFEIDNEFVVGYGLDYRGMGRNLPDIFREVPDSR